MQKTNCRVLPGFLIAIASIQTQKPCFAKAMYLFVGEENSSRSHEILTMLQIRYYTIARLAFDVLQIHTFAIPGVKSFEL